MFANLKSYRSISKCKFEPRRILRSLNLLAFIYIPNVSTTLLSNEKYFFFVEYFKNGYTLYLNSGLSSSRNHYGQRVITREADLVTAHEFGHNWGSEHDPDIPECSPSASQGGSYLMYTYSVSGYDVNNKVGVLPSVRYFSIFHYQSSLEKFLIRCS